MPVRKIPKNYLFVTGGYSSQKNKVMDGFESLLEKEYLFLLDFDETVESFETQPIRVPLPGVAKGYVPDVLVKYRWDPILETRRKPLLVDVKHTDELKRNGAKYANKFAAAHQYAEQQGWEFAIVDQTQIRIPKLANLKFLREYRNFKPDQVDVQAVLDKAVLISDTLTSASLLAALAKTDDERLYWLPIIWHMVLHQQLIADLERPFSNDVPLWLSGVEA